MAVLPDYTSGTITLATGSTTVTGMGTLFNVAQFREGDTLQIQNLTAVIASIDSNTQLTLAEPWTGASMTDAPYRARYLPDGARVTAQTTTLIEMLGKGILPGIANMPNGVSGQVISVDITGSPVWVDNVGYAEGLWTPRVNFGGLSAGQAYTEQTGTYIRVGNLVFCKFRVTFSARGTSTGNSNIEGLPFQIAADGFGGVVSIGFYSNMALTEPGITGFFSTGSSFALRTLSTTGSTPVQHWHFTNTSSIIGGLVYKAAS